jgi:hypothetical protein
MPIISVIDASFRYLGQKGQALKIGGSNKTKQ